MNVDIRSIQFKGFKGIDIEKLLVILKETKTYYDKISLRQMFKAYKNSRWYDMYTYECMQHKGNKYIAFYSDYYFRNDHLEIFQNFIKAFAMFDYVVPIRLPKDRINLKRGCIMSVWDICNLWKLRKLDISFKEKVLFVRILGLIAWYQKKMDKYLNTGEYIYGLVYSDSNPYENVLVQNMKLKGMHTATLQHGMFDKHGYWKGLEFRTSVSDDWLAWNQHTKELAMECGILKEKIKVLGIPRYINPVIIDKKSKKGVFSIILGAAILFDENRKLIEFANSLSKEWGMKYFIRYHPSCKSDEYKMFIEQQFYVLRNSQEESVNQMCEQSDFSLVGSGTSMIIDLIYLKQPFMQYYERWDGKEYKRRKNYFRNLGELKEGLQKKDSLQSDGQFYYYCTTAEVKESYARYFMKFSTEIPEENKR